MTITGLNQWVQFTGTYTWCGSEKHGMTGTVIEIVNDTDGDIAMVEEFLGHWGNGDPAFGIPVPLLLSELVPCPAPVAP